MKYGTIIQIIIVKDIGKGINFYDLYRRFWSALCNIRNIHREAEQGMRGKMKKRYFGLVALSIVMCFAACKKENKDQVLKENEAPVTIQDGEDISIPDFEEGNQQTVKIEEIEEQLGKQTKEFFREEKNEFVGIVNEKAVHMTLSWDGETIRGVYSYDKKQKDIDVLGMVEQRYKDYPVVTLQEKDKDNQSFQGIIVNQDLLEGYYKVGDKFYAMYLVRVNSNVTIPEKKSETQAEWKGYWYGKKMTYYTSSTIIVRPLFQDMIYYQISAKNGAAKGYVEGIAIQKDDVYQTNFLERSQKDDWNVTEDNETKQEDTIDYVTFKLSITDDILNVTSNQYDYQCEKQVFYESTYTKSKPEIKVPTPLEAQIVQTKEQEEEFLNIVGEYYELFVGNTQYVLYERSTLDGKDAIAGKSYLIGEVGKCYYILMNETIYAAVFDGNKIRYFTNDITYADRMPDCMKEWAEGFQVQVQYLPKYKGISRKFCEDYIKNHIDAILSGSIENFFDYATIRAYCKGDLNLDGKEDVAVVVKYQDKTDYLSIYVYLKQKEGYDLIDQNHTLISGNTIFDEYNDNYQSITIEDGKLSVGLNKQIYSDFKKKYTFTYEDGLPLSYVERFEDMTNGNAMHITYQVPERTMEKRTWDAKKAKKHNLLLYKGELKDEDIMFHNIKCGDEEKLQIPMRYPLPDITSYGSVWSYNQKQICDAEKALDKVKETFFPNMKKVLMPCSKEIIQNYEKLLQYHIPDYYYSDGVAVLYYDNFWVTEEEEEHYIYYAFLKDLNSFDKYYQRTVFIYDAITEEAKEEVCGGI